MSEIEATRDRIHRWVAANAPDVLASLGPSATGTQFQDAEPPEVLARRANELARGELTTAPDTHGPGLVRVRDP